MCKCKSICELNNKMYLCFKFRICSGFLRLVVKVSFITTPKSWERSVYFNFEAIKALRFSDHIIVLNSSELNDKSYSYIRDNMCNINVNPHVYMSLRYIVNKINISIIFIGSIIMLLLLD